jgi:hypothetical protein
MWKADIKPGVEYALRETSARVRRAVERATS